MDDGVRSGATEIGLEKIGDTLRRFAEGEMDRRLVMDRLDVSYGEMLDMLHHHRLRIPVAPSAERAAMANALDRLLDEARD